jgi:hypothetical protein
VPATRKSRNIQATDQPFATNLRLTSDEERDVIAQSASPRSFVCEWSIRLCRNIAAAHAAPLMMQQDQEFTGRPQLAI